MTSRLRWLVLLVLALLAPRVAAQETPAAEAKPEPAAVRFWNRDLFTIRGMLGRLTPAERARAIEARLADLPDDAMFAEVTIAPTQFAGIEVLGVDIGGHFIVGLLPDDPDVEGGQTMAEYGALAQQSLRELLEARREQGQVRYWVIGIVLALVATAALVAACWLVMRVRRAALARADARIRAAKLFVLRKIDLREELVHFARTALVIASWAVWLLLAYLWATFVLTRFHFTSTWGEALGGQLLALGETLLTGALSSLPGILAVVVIGLVARGVGRFTSHIFHRIENGQLEVSWLEADSARAARRLTIGAIWIFALVAAYPYVPGSSSEAFKGLSVILGLMISLGSSGVVNQIMSGFVVVMSRSVRTGEFARIGSHTGRITEVGLLSVRIHTGRGEQVTVPNAVVLSQEVVNYSRLAEKGGVVITTGVTIGYDAPWRQVHAMLVEAARRTPALATEPAPFVRQAALSDFYVEYVLVAQAKQADDAPLARSELHGHIQDVFNEHGVQIMSPHFEGQPENAVVVPRERWHAAPAKGPERA